MPRIGTRILKKVSKKAKISLLLWAFWAFFLLFSILYEVKNLRILNKSPIFHLHNFKIKTLPGSFSKEWGW